MHRRSIVRERLTGKVRSKRQFLTGKSVLQVEVHFESQPAYPPCPPPSGYKDPQGWARREAERREKSWKVIHTYYRDARPSEIAEVKKLVAA